jgi:hypothetical protein
MITLMERLKILLRDINLFVTYASRITLRNYQREPALAIVDSVVNAKGLSFVIIFPRQSGKNELQAQIQTYLLTIFSMLEVEMVSISPTWKPQSYNAMRRLENTLSTNLISRDIWAKHRDYIYRIGKARIYFLSGSPTANIVGTTANLLLSIDEAQDIQTAKYDKEIAPMAASTNATRVFWGTAWTSNTLLAREEQAARALQEEDGIQRVWKLTCDQVAAEVPPYGDFVADQVARLGRNHPMVRTQYYSEQIDADGGLFPPERLALIYGIHPPQIEPQPGEVYVMTLDVAGEDESGSEGTLTETIESLANPARDATALTIARVDLTTIDDPGLRLPSYQIVYRQQWVGIKHTQIYGAILAFAATWNIKYLICDATGVGAGLTAFLARALGSKVIPFSFNSKSKSDLGWSFLSLIDTGRIKDYSLVRNQSAPDVHQRHEKFVQSKSKNKTLASLARLQAAPDVCQHQAMLAHLHTTFFRQLEFCQYEIIPGPDKKIKWSVPDRTTDPATGDFLHDDLITCAALLTVVDDKPWTTAAPTVIINAKDPLAEMKGF